MVTPKWMFGDDPNHTHVFGPIETARFTGEVVRRCVSFGCRVVDVYPEQDIGECPTCGADAGYPCGHLLFKESK